MPILPRRSCIPRIPNKIQNSERTINAFLIAGNDSQTVFQNFLNYLNFIKNISIRITAVSFRMFLKPMYPSITISINDNTFAVKLYMNLIELYFDLLLFVTICKIVWKTKSSISKQLIILFATINCVSYYLIDLYVMSVIIKIFAKTNMYRICL